MTPGRGEFNSPISSQKKEASFMAVGKSARVVQVLDCIFMTDSKWLRCLALLPVPLPCDQCGWSDTKLTCLMPLNKTWGALRRAVLQLLCNLSLEFCHGHHTSGTEGVTVLQPQLSSRSGWAAFGLLGFNTVYILMAFTTAVSGVAFSSTGFLNSSCTIICLGRLLGTCGRRAQNCRNLQCQLSRS